MTTLSPFCALLIFALGIIEAKLDDVSEKYDGWFCRKCDDLSQQADESRLFRRLLTVKTTLRGR